LPQRAPGLEADEGWWQDVLAGPRLKPSRELRLPKIGEYTRQRLDRLPVLSLTFTCAWCKQRATRSLDELIETFGPNRNVHRPPRSQMP
jgi:hypothetical protein